MGLQGMIKSILDDSVKRALVITPKPLSYISKFIMNVARSELSHSGLEDAESRRRCRAILDSVMLSVVFDIDGVWQTLSELLRSETSMASTSEYNDTGDSKAKKARNDDPVAEIRDSEDEELSQFVSPLLTDSPRESGATSQDGPELTSAVRKPEIIVITHFSTLLTSLFARREKTAAHNSLAFLKARLRELSSSPNSSPLILLVNSTANEVNTKHKIPPSDIAGYSAGNKSTEYLRSIFASAHTLRPSRPSFGVIFNQFLDLHLLCTDVSIHDAVSLGKVSATRRLAQSPTLVEVLQDNLRIDSPHDCKYHREQRWAVLGIANQRLVNGSAD